MKKSVMRWAEKNSKVLKRARNRQEMMIDDDDDDVMIDGDDRS